MFILTSSHPQKQTSNLFLSQILVKPVNTLLLSIIHCFLILLTTPITQRKPVHLILINPQFMRHIRFLSHDILDLPNRVYVQQTILRPHSQAQRLRHGLKISWNGYQARMARMAYLPPPQKPIVPILPVPGMALTAEMNNEIRGFETLSRCLTNRGGKVTDTVPVALVLSIRLCCSRTLSGAPTDCRNSMGRLSP
jgi:hypothetical protein